MLAHGDWRGRGGTVLKLVESFQCLGGQRFNLQQQLLLGHGCHAHPTGDCVGQPQVRCRVKSVAAYHCCTRIARRISYDRRAALHFLLRCHLMQVHNHKYTRARTRQTWYSVFVRLYF